MLAKKKHTQHKPSTKRECDYLNGWIKKSSHIRKNLNQKWWTPKIYLGNAEKEFLMHLVFCFICRKLVFRWKRWGFMCVCVVVAETHRTVLNQILRQSTLPLADGPFSVLVDHTRMLDFDVKRRYFRQELERADEGLRREDLPVHVRREHVFEDSYRELHRRTPEEWKQRFYIVFEGGQGWSGCFGNDECGCWVNCLLVMHVLVIIVSDITVSWV